jgi:hypothetical protein
VSRYCTLARSVHQSDETLGYTETS